MEENTMKEKNIQEKIMREKTGVRTKRIGTTTFGCMLILFGLLFLTHMFFPQLTYIWIFRLWPVIFIVLGMEILISNIQKADKVIYDGMAMFLMAFLTLFAMGMAAADLVIQYQEQISLHF